MNYNMSLLAIFASYLITLNTWAGCCFIEPSVNLPPPTYRCINTRDAAICNQLVGVAYVNNNASCMSLFTCCIQGETAFEFHDKGIIEEVVLPGCNPAIVLPVNLIDFTATLEADGYVYLDGRAVAFGDRGFVEIWRAQIRDDGHGGRVTSLKRIGVPTPTEEDYVEFPFSAIDTHPLRGVNYYIPADRNTDGEYTAHCRHIQHVVVEGGEPNLALARRLCRQHRLVPLLQIFAP
jgi:hypothetical protein